MRSKIIGQKMVNTLKLVVEIYFWIVEVEEDKWMPILKSEGIYCIQMYNTNYIINELEHKTFAPPYTLHNSVVQN